MDERKDVTTKKDVKLLVTNFYAKIRKDDLLGPIFNGMIEDWEQHLNHLTNFWCSQLFIERTYNGNPIEVHRKVDKFAQHKIDEHYFGKWLNYWIQTIDEDFKGDNSFILKNRARKMASFIHIDIFTHRKH
ncbi:globin [Flavobacteriaceae bacterium R38]|nr:globin [Flavobacteriaceae bacterium R38]